MMTETSEKRFLPAWYSEGAITLDWYSEGAVPPTVTTACCNGCR